MIYRESTFLERCRFCTAPTESRCARCGSLACDRHLFTDDEVCGPCHDRYEQMLERREEPVLVKRGIVVATTLGTILATGSRMPFVGLFLGIGGVLLWFAVHQYLLARHRQRFLEERRK